MVVSMQTDETPTAPAPDLDAAADAPVEAESLPGRHRSHRGEARHRRLSPRFTAEERAEVIAAAASAGCRRRRFCAEAALAAARGTPMVLGAAQDREALARLQRQLFAARTEVVRFGTNVNQAVAALNTTGEAPEWMGRAIPGGDSVSELDEVIAEVDRRLR